MVPGRKLIGSSKRSRDLHQGNEVRLIQMLAPQSSELSLTSLQSHIGMTNHSLAEGLRKHSTFGKVISMTCLKSAAAIHDPQAELWFCQTLYSVHYYIVLIFVCGLLFNSIMILVWFRFRIRVSVSEPAAMRS